MKLAVNTDLSGFRVDLTQSEINAYVSAIVSAIPSCTHIVINTYLDYPVQISRWEEAIHSAGKKCWVRSWGYNFWQGKNGVDVDNTLQALANHRSQQQTFIADNASIFSNGDVWSPVPDEPENWEGWGINYTSLGTVEGKAAYNAFIQDSIDECNAAFDLAGVSVETGYVATNPSVSLSTINSTTADKLEAMLIDAYFDGETGNDAYPWHPIVDAHIAGTTMKYAVDRYVNPSQGGKAYHYNMGVNKYIDMTEAQQADSYNAQMFSLIKNANNLDGITVWPAGRTTNPSMSLLTYSDGNWTPKSCCNVIDHYFYLLINGSDIKRKIVL